MFVSLGQALYPQIAARLYALRGVEMVHEGIGPMTTEG